MMPLAINSLSTSPRNMGTSPMSHQSPINDRPFIEVSLGITDDLQAGGAVGSIAGIPPYERRVNRFLCDAAFLTWRKYCSKTGQPWGFLPHLAAIRGDTPSYAEPSATCAVKSSIPGGRGWTVNVSSGSISGMTKPTSEYRIAGRGVDSWRAVVNSFALSNVQSVIFPKPCRCSGTTICGMLRLPGRRCCTWSTASSIQAFALANPKTPYIPTIVVDNTAISEKK